MASNTQLFDMASLAEAAYATFTDASGALTIASKVEFINRLQDFDADGQKDTKSFSRTQAEEFADHYRVISQQPNTDSGYSATLFERLDEAGVGTSEYVFSQRGTEAFTQLSPTAPLGLDLAVDLGDLVADGLAWSQIVDMCNYWKQLTTPAGQIYQKTTLVAVPIVTTQASIYDIGTGHDPQKWQIQLTDASSPAGPKVPAGAALEVTGHSLGGHLASAFTRMFDGVASQAYTMNGAGYSKLGSANIQYVFSQLGGANSFTSTAVQNLRGSAGPDIVTQNSGLVQVGASDQIFIEQGGLFADNPLLSAAAVFGHRATQITDSAAVYDLFIQIDADAATRSPSQYLPKLLGVFEAGANTKAESLEEMVRALARTFDVDSSPIATDNREALHARIKLIRDDPDFQSVVGQVLIRPQGFDLRAAARNDFGALAALIDLTPFSITGKDDAGSAALAAVWASTRLEDYAAWQADKAVAKPTTFTDSWIADRAAMLALVIQRNTSDIAGIMSGNTNLRYFDAASNTEVLVGAGSDQRVQYAFGGEAADTLNGQGFSDHLYGGDGDDTLNGLGGNDYIEGGRGVDILDGGDGNDQLFGGAGTDTYQFTGSFGQDIILDSDGLGQIKIGDTTLSGGKETVAGSRVWQSEDKQFRYTLVAGRDGNQTLIIYSASGGDSILVKNFQNRQLGITLDDALAPESVVNPDRTIVGDLAPIDFDPVATGVQSHKDDLGNVVTNAEQADPGRVDILYDSSGNDLLQGKDGADNLLAIRGGDDRLEAGNGNDYADGGAGNDTLLGDAGNDFLVGGAGNDTLLGGAGSDIFEGGDDNDRLYSNIEVDTAAAIAQGRSQTGTMQKGDWLNGGKGDDALIAGADDDALFGGAGDDLLVGGAGDDVLDGDDDFTAGDSSWTITSPAYGNFFESNFGLIYNNNPVIGFTGGSDVLYGGAGNDRLYGVMGNDLLYGEDGSDILAGDDGDDILFGGAGNDILTGDYGRSTYVTGIPVVQGDDYLDGGDGDDSLYGEGGGDTLFGGAGADILHGDSGTDPTKQGDDYLDGEDGDDQLYGGGGADELFGGAGNDFLSGDWDNLPLETQGNDILDGEDGDDTLVGAGGDDTLFGGEGQDNLQGGNGDDTLEGEAGDDTLFGNEGNDILSGGSGDDTVNGGSGDDIYIFNVGDGHDTLSDMEGANTLRFGAGIAPADIAFSRIGNDLVLALNGSADQLTIQNWGNNTAARLESMEFSDGTAWDAAYVHTQALLQPITGTSEDDSLSAWIGETTTTMIGGQGGDTYTVQRTAQVVQENSNEGYDTVVSSIDYALGVCAAEL